MLAAAAALLALGGGTAPTSARGYRRVRVDGRFTPAGVHGTLSVVRGDCRTGQVTFAGAL